MATTPPINYGRYPSYPLAEQRPRTMPRPCKKLFDQLKACEAKVYPHQSNCFRDRFLFRMCVRVTTFGSSH